MSTPTRPRDAEPRVVRDRLEIDRDAPTLYVSGRRPPRFVRSFGVRLRAFTRPRTLDDRVRPFGVASMIAASWAVVMGLVVVCVPVLLTWALAANAKSGTPDAAVASADVWLAAHHVGFSVPGGRLALLPIGLIVVPVLLLRLAFGWAARILRPASLADAGLLVGATSVAYGLLAGLVAAITGRPELSAPVPETVLVCALVASITGAWTVVRVGGLGEQVVALVPRRLSSVVRPAVTALVTVLAGSVAITLVVLVARGGDVLAVGRALDTGLVGGLMLLVLSVAYLPNLVLWASAFCVGPGFAVGAGTSVTLAGVSSGPLPAFPLLAAVPSSGVPAAPAWLCLLVPFAGGLAAAWSTTRRRPGLDPESAALWAGLAGVCAGLALGALAWLSGGPLGPDRLATFGPSPWQVGALAAIEVGTVAAVAAWLLGWRATRRTPA